jgi:hypothetical protein
MKPWIVGFVVGVLLTILTGLFVVWAYRVEIVNLVSSLYGQRVIGKTKVLLRDSVLYQDGKEVGVLRRGTHLLHRLQTESLEEFYLPIGWEDTGDMEHILIRAEETERAFVTLETTDFCAEADQTHKD